MLGALEQSRTLFSKSAFSDDIVWDLTNCVPFWSYNTGLAYGVLKTFILFIIPLIFMIVLYISIINKLWNSDKIEGWDFILLLLDDFTIILYSFPTR